MGKRSVFIGRAAEALVRMSLQQRYVMVERVHTPFTLIRKNGKVVGAYPVEKVSGDFIAMEPGTGRKVLVEVKSRNRTTLRWSDLEPHQVDKLNETNDNGGIALLAFLDLDGRLGTWYWPVESFGRGGSITVDEADYVI